MSSDDDWLNDGSDPAMQKLAENNNADSEVAKLYDLGYGAGYKESRQEYIPKNFKEGVLEGHVLGQKSGVIEGKIDALHIVMQKLESLIEKEKAVE